MTRNDSLTWLLEEKLGPDDLAWDHAMEVSASVYKRMKELGLKKKDLAKLMGVKPARISRILSGEQSMTLKTLARLEITIGMDMGTGFKNPECEPKPSHGCSVIEFETLKNRRQLAATEVTLCDAREG